MAMWSPLPLLLVGKSIWVSFMVILAKLPDSKPADETVTTMTFFSWFWVVVVADACAALL